MTRYAFRNDAEWWRHAVVYQVFPASFRDTDGDGTGDLQGIRSRLDHLEWLGVDAIWLSPIHPSPMLDGGYDIGDFLGVDPRFGSMEDFDGLLRACHARGIRLILDFVPNHTSDQHPWFIESRSSRKNARRDWYVWRDPATDGGPPNNWLSRFGGSAWELDRATGQYYYHAFLKEQPDLNWRNAEVREAMSEVLRFWMRRGVDGFRVDATGVLIEDDLLRDDPPKRGANDEVPPPERQTRVFTDSRPEAFECLARLRSVVDEFPHRLMAGEADTSAGMLGRFYGEPSAPALHLPLNFGLLDAQWDGLSVTAAIDTYLGRVPAHGWPSWALGGHNKRRIAERLGPAQARVAAMLHLTLPGTCFFYAGNEIGMPQVPVPPERIRDPFETLVPGYGLGRDPERTPMRWDDGPGAGFTTGEPWLPIGSCAPGLNVAAQREDGRSMLHLYRRLIALRKEEPALHAPSIEPLRGTPETVAFRRRHPGQPAALILLNLSAVPQTVDLPGPGRVLLSTHLDREDDSLAGSTILRPAEGLVIREEQR
jgi:alpha-glucosidase